MTEGTEQDVKKDARVSRPGKLVLRKTVETGQVRQSFSHGRSKTVTVEVRRKRTFAQTETGGMVEVKETASEPSEAAKQAAAAAWAAETETTGAGDKDSRRPTVLRTLTDEEKGARARAFETARRVDQETHRQTAAEVAVRAEREAQEAAEREAAVAAGAARKAAEEEESRQKTATQEASAKATEETRRPAKAAETAPAAEDDQEKGRAAAKRGKGDLRRPGAAARRDQPRRRAGKLTIGQALNEEDRVRSLASVRRARDRERGRRTVQPANKPYTDPGKVVREVVVPETITVQELANRMAVRGAGLIKSLMKMGTMCTITQSIDADTAELLVHEFGHTVKRVTAADIEVGLKGEADAEETLKPRPPVVTVMGHVDHGKTSLLDALRSTDVVSGEAGGITQHIGAYHVTLESGDRITFIDTPGHAAFTAMRGRGASCTDIVVLVVAADDGVMPQTIEAINHAKAADVPIIVAINKMDRPDANGDRVRNELLQHGIVVEEMGGEVLSVEISALKKLNLDKLTEAIHLQAELLDLTANPDRPAEGVVVEAKLERGRGPVATVLVQRGTLRVGDIVVAGGEWARVRALFDERGNEVKEAGPSMPVEIIGLSGVPNAGEDLMSVENEKRAREVAEYRQERVREARAAAGTRGTLEQMFADISSGEANEMAVVIKADVQGSVEALAASLEKLSTDEVAVRVLHTGVGGINESDVTLAQASGAVILGFNVRANAQARTRARADNIEIRYYSIIYNVIDDVRAVLSGMLAPDLRERIVGNAQVLEVFDITKLGKIAGCRVTDGLIKRGATVRLLRDDTVIFEGRLATLKRFKEDAREVKEGLECGMSFENYHDLRTGDIIEAVEIDEIARTL